MQRNSVGEEVFAQMKQRILDGEWKTGDKLPSEGELCNIFGVSRITIRQAIQKLRSMGVIETRLGSGSYVLPVDAGVSMQDLIPSLYLGSSMEQVMDFREIVETGCARLAAKMSTDEDIRELREILDEMNRIKETKDVKHFAELDARFHFKIGNITKNPLVIKTNQILREVLEGAMDQIISQMGFEPAIKYHTLLIDAIEAHDEKKAVSLMREHLQANYAYKDLQD